MMTLKEAIREVEKGHINHEGKFISPAIFRAADVLHRELWQKVGNDFFKKARG